MSASAIEMNSPARRAGTGPLRSLLYALASLKFTLVLLSLAMLLILFGTVAQAKIGMWDVLSHYFKSFLVWVEFQHLVPRAWNPSLHDSLSGGSGFPFPGGITIGSCMMLNLVLAHALKFRVRARGVRLLTGVLAMGLGIGVTYAVIGLGQFRQGLSADPLVPWEMMAKLTTVSAVAITVGLYLIAASLGGQAYAEPTRLGWPKTVLALVAALVSTLVCVLLFSFREDVSALRILWQLIQGTIAGIVLLGACWLLFENRAGIVLLHGGLGLMMFGEAWVTYQAKEQQMQIVEGETALYAQDIRTAELAIVETVDEDERHIAIPEEWLTASAHRDAADIANFMRSWFRRLTSRISFLRPQLNEPGRISAEQLPFDLEVMAWYPNSKLEAPKPDSKNLATKGAGLRIVALETPVNSGASSDGEVDLPAAYVRVIDKSTHEPIGVYLASLLLNADGRGELIRVGDRKFSLQLRFEREYKPYRVALKDFRREDYPGSNTPRTYESRIRMVDSRYAVDREVRISMNNPFRYLGETFYQSSFRPADGSGRETTVLQVVTNSGWMIPYVACMIVLVGLTFQFSRTLLMYLAGESQPFAAEIDDEAFAHLPAGHRPAARMPTLPGVPAEPLVNWFVPSASAIVLIITAGVWIAYGARPPKAAKDGFDLYAFGQIPAMSGGRSKPLDSIARETLLAVSNDVNYKDADDARQPAIRWLLEIIARPEKARELRVIRLESNEVAEALGLKLQRDYRYSLSEFQENQEKVMQQFEQLAKKDEDQYTIFDNQLLKLDKRLQAAIRINNAFESFDLAGMLQSLEPTEDPAEIQRRIGAAAELIATKYRGLDKTQAPLAVPFENVELQRLLGGKRWLPLSTALAMFDLQKLNPHGNADEERPLELWREIIAARRDDASEKFNRAVQQYLAWERDQRHPDFSASRIGLEAWFNHMNPFGWTQGIGLYLVALLLSLVALLGWQQPLSKAAFWLLVVTFLLHTFALAARMYIAGRPPVTNLYSSAVFIGWAMVLIGLLLEAWSRLNIGNLLASIGGALSLRIALALSFEGDTIGVMQAVLDTQFWLATHVVCITLGYAATFVAGFLGIFYILYGVFSPRLTGSLRQQLARMIYGVVCFALLLSFFGTVLGGLWADDSWGRFWGWDPKENGALLIVLWNALILHARWDRLARDRGLAVLAVAGNLVTSWSWFGTNQLGVGLHSYGFTQGTLDALRYNLFAHLAIIGVGCLPLGVWWSYRQESDKVAGSVGSDH